MKKAIMVKPHYNNVNPFVIAKGGAIEFIAFLENVFKGKKTYPSEHQTKTEV